MTIVLNETLWAEEMIRTRSLGKKPSETLLRVARYYLDKNYSRDETRRMLDVFLSQCDSMVSLPKWSSLLDFTVKRAIKTPAIVINEIDVSIPEMKVIDSLKSARTRRLAFTLLCLAKYYDQSGRCGDHWVNSEDSDIMRMANIQASIRDQSTMYNELKTLGLIRFSKKVDNTNIQVCFVKPGETALRVTSFFNLGYQYLLYHGNPNYFMCHGCGNVFRKSTVVDRSYLIQKGRPQKYCSACAKQMKIEQTEDFTIRLSRSSSNESQFNH